MQDPIITAAETNGPLNLAALFGSHTSLEVDVGCGKGRFLIARAAAHPNVNFLGIERRLKRVIKVAAKIRRSGLVNARILHAEAAHAVCCLLPPGSVDCFYVFFPDPWPKRRHQRRRLFCPAMLDAFHRALRPGGAIHVATDDVGYFQQITSLFAHDERFETIAPFLPTEAEQTEFELTFFRIGKPVQRCSYRAAAARSLRASEP